MLIIPLCNVQLGLGFVLAEEKVSANENFSKLFYECQGYVLATCERNVWNEKLDELCQVYETVETMLTSPEEVMQTLKQAEEAPMQENGSPAGGELKLQFLKLAFGRQGPGY
ncbi:hypothetical protein V6N11_052129 [Hibiscus sabdariffa]|uniref:Uncharacterized protein n=1 Tax=Hibiscus sabdariffa TaxID=183260 RepID=A0ABR2U9V4_9ROSI